MNSLTRRGALRTLSALPAASIVTAVPRIARAAEFSYKYGNNLPLTHPLNIRAQEAADRIARETKGRVEIKIFPNNQLGGDTDMLAQVRSGGIEFFTPSALVIATLVPVAAINAIGFAFSDYNQVWGAMDGKLGAHVRDALLDFRLAVIGHQETKKRVHPQAMPGGHPGQARPQMRPVVAEIAREQGRDKQGHHRARLAKARQLGHKAKIGLVVGITEHGNIRALHLERGAGQGGNRLLPVETIAGNDGLACEHQGWLCDVHRPIGPAHAIAVTVCRIADPAPANRDGPLVRRCEDPAQPWVGLAHRLLAGLCFGGGEGEFAPHRPLTHRQGQDHGKRDPQAAGGDFAR